MGCHMVSHTPLESPLGISIWISMISTPPYHHLEWSPGCLRYLQNPEIWLFWTYPRIHGFGHFGPFWTSEIAPVSSYSRLGFQIWAHLGHVLAPLWSVWYSVWVCGMAYATTGPLECPLGMSICIYCGMVYDMTSDIMSQEVSGYLQIHEIWLFWTHFQMS